jgi:hypothetical protein
MEPSPIEADPAGETEYDPEPIELSDAHGSSRGSRVYEYARFLDWETTHAARFLDRWIVAERRAQRDRRMRPDAIDEREL